MGIGFIVYGVAISKIPHSDSKKCIIEQTTDERGLISVVFAEGKDTFGLDYLTLEEYKNTFK